MSTETWKFDFWSCELASAYLIYIFWFVSENNFLTKGVLTSHISWHVDTLLVILSHPNSHLKNTYFYDKFSTSIRKIYVKRLAIYASFHPLCFKKLYVFIGVAFTIYTTLTYNFLSDWFNSSNLWTRGHMTTTLLICLNYLFIVSH